MVDAERVTNGEDQNEQNTDRKNSPKIISTPPRQPSSEPINPQSW